MFSKRVDLTKLLLEDLDNRKENRKLVKYINKTLLHCKYFKIRFLCRQTKQFEEIMIQAD